MSHDDEWLRLCLSIRTPVRKDDSGPQLKPGDLVQLHNTGADFALRQGERRT